MTETTKWDIIDSLTSEKAIESYLEAIFEDGDPGLIKAAIGDYRAKQAKRVPSEQTVA